MFVVLTGTACMDPTYIIYIEIQRHGISIMYSIEGKENKKEKKEK